MEKKSTAIRVPDDTIINKIHLVRGCKIMLDSDIAELYGVETKRLKEQVKRNLQRFPSHFMFELTQEEHNSLRSQNATLERGAHSKYLPYAFTEHGILMLSNILKSESAMLMSIKIIDVFVKLRETLLAHKEILLQLEKLEKQTTNNGADITMIFKVLKQLIAPAKKKREMIGFKTPSTRNEL